MTERSFTLSTELSLPPEALAAIFTLQGVNAELAPWIRMTAPAQRRNQSVLAWPVGQPLFASWILLFGVLPLDRHHFRLESVEADRGFHESSTSIINRVWRHTRFLEPTATGSRITDTVCFECRLTGLTVLFAPLYRGVFRWRHRRLRRYCQA